MAAVWSTSYPGVVTPFCGSPERLEVHNTTGRMLRQGSEAFLCFECGPNGGHYHPEVAREAEHRADGYAGPLATMDDVRQLALEMDVAYNRFEVHEHNGPLSGHQSHRRDHSHVDGSEPHSHPDHGSAGYAITTEDRALYLLGGNGEERKWTAKPTGPQLDYIETPEAERTFHVVFVDEMFSPVGGQVRHSGHEDERADFERSRQMYLQASRTPGSVVVGPSAIPLAACRMMLRFRYEPIYVFEPYTAAPVGNIDGIGL